jgi:SAM-dependent methyltransferase
MERLPAHRGEEHLDSAALGLAERERSLAELDRVNLLLLGSLPLARTLLPRLAPGPPRLALDLGTGSGAVAAALARKAALKGAPLAIVGFDRGLAHLAFGRRRGNPQLRVVGDAQALPFRDGAFAWSFQTLFFHHFDAAENRRVLAEMRRVSREGAAVVDLRRSRLLFALLHLALPLLGAGRVTREDGYLSARKAWTIPEAARLTEGLPVAELRRRIPFRFSLVLRPGG